MKNHKQVSIMFLIFVLQAACLYILQAGGLWQKKVQNLFRNLLTTFIQFLYSFYKTFIQFSYNFCTTFIQLLYNFCTTFLMSFIPQKVLQSLEIQCFRQIPPEGTKGNIPDFLKLKLMPYIPTFILKLIIWSLFKTP